MTAHHSSQIEANRAAWTGPAGWFLAVSGLLLAAAYMAHTVLGNTGPKDFSYFWIAGQIWLDGGNPYAPAFSATANAMAAAHPEMAGLGGFHRWLYGPHIWAVATGLGGLDYLSARMLWGGLGAGAVLAGSALGLASVLRPRDPLFLVLLGPLWVLSAVTLGTVMSVSVGQFAPFTFLAISTFCYGILRRSGLAVTIALIVLTMKPNLAMPFVGFALIVPAARVPLFAAGAISLALAVPVALTTPLSEVMAGYLDGLSAYGGYRANLPNALTGMGNLIHAAAGVTLSGVIYAALGAMAGMSVGWRARRRGASPEALAALIAIAGFLVPLHLYDLTLIVLLLMLWPWPWWGALALIANLAMLRVNRLGQMVGLNDADSRFQGSFPASLLLLALMLAALWLWLRPGAGRHAQTDQSR